MRPTSTSSEEKRLSALDRLGILDTAPEKAFDDLAELAAMTCAVPIALVSFVARDRQWFKARVGLDATETPRDISFCTWAIQDPTQLFIVEDALADPRFARNPLVTGEPHIRFYAGAPVVMADGTVPCTLCIIDRQPRRLEAAQYRALERLARQVALLLDMRALKRAADEARRQSDELLELVLRGGDLGLWDLDLATGHYTINAREREMLGYSADEAQPGKLDWRALMHPDDAAAFTRTFTDHVAGRTPFSESTHRLRHRDGRWIWVLDRAVVVERDKQGAALRVVGTHIDVTRQKRVEEAERQAKERLELALSGGDIGLWDLDIGTGLATYNDQWWRMFGYAPGEVEVVEGLWKRMVHPDDHPASQAGLAAHIAGETAMYEIEARVRHKDGHWIWVQNRAKVMNRDAEGRAKRIVGVTLNITRRKEDSLALSRAGELLNRTSAIAKVGGWEVDPVTQALTWTDEVFRIHELPVGTPPTVEQAIDFYPPESRLAMAQAVSEGLAHGTPWDLEVPMRTATGRHIWVRALGQTETIDGQVTRVFGTFQDVTETRLIRDRLRDEEHRIRLITDNLPASIAHFDLEERYTFANRFAGDFFGIDSATMLGRKLREVRGDTLYAKVARHVKTVLGGKPVAFESEGFAQDRTFYMQSSFIPDIASDGRVQGFYTMTFDVTEAKVAAARSAESERRLRGLTDAVPVLLSELDEDRNVVFCNGRFESWLGIPPAQLVGRQIRECVSEAHYEMRKPMLDRAYEGETVSFEQTALLRIGERTLQTTYLPQKGADGKVTGLYVVANDVSDMKQKHIQLHALASEDALTRLPNRRSFEERFVEAVARSHRAGTALALMYLDIDHFKTINDSHGHATGDAVLKEFGRRLGDCVRDTDMAARYAGDEFVVLLEGLDCGEDAAVVARKILRAMRPMFLVPTGPLQVTTSIGVAIAEEQDHELQPLLARADAELYAAKKAGRNTFRMTQLPIRDGH